MGSFIEINDTLQLTAEQGFPKELDLDIHLQSPYLTKIFVDKTFAFHDKPEIRIYKAPPVRNFLVENRGGKWIYWGQVFIIEQHHDYEKRMTSGKFRIIHIYSPEEMKMAHRILDRNIETDYFGSLNTKTS